MSLPPEVQNLRVTQDVRFDRLGQITPVKVVTFTVGDHGPFTIGIPLGEYTAELVERMVSRELTTLRSLGAIK